MIRAATADDIPRLLELGALMHAESPRFSRLEFNPERLRLTLASLVDSPFGFVWVAGDVPYAVLVAICSPHWCSQDLVATDLALFVAPQARGSIAPARLVKRYVAWARDRGAVLINLGVSTGVNTEGTTQLLERLGLQRAGIILEAA